MKPGRMPRSQAEHWRVLQVVVETGGYAQAAAALHGEAVSKNPDKILETLAPAAPYEYGSQAMIRVGFLTCYPIYFRAEAYLAARQGAQATAEFQKILDHPQLTLTDPVGAMAFLGLARAASLSGDRAKSLAAYERFLALWKDAGPGAPLKKQAAMEYAQLKNSPRAAPQQKR